MSFILDALRKSEHDRQRQAGPALAEIPVAAPKSRSNPWAPAAVGLLLVNLVVVAVILLPKSHEPAAQRTRVVAPQPARSAASVNSAPTTAGALQPATASPVAAAPVAVPPPVAPPSAVPTLEPRPAAGVEARNPLEAETSGGSPTLDPRMAAAASAPPGPPAVTRLPTARGSVVYEQLPDAATVGSPHRGSAPATTPAAAESALASADQLVAAGVPALNLDLHVYSTRPADRMVFINARKYHEGDKLQEGPVVRQITPAGVVLEYNGRAYFLTHD